MTPPAIRIYDSVVAAHLQGTVNMLRLLARISKLHLLPVVWKFFAAVQADDISPGQACRSRANLPCSAGKWKAEVSVPTPKNEVHKVPMTFHENYSGPLQARPHNLGAPVDGALLAAGVLSYLHGVGEVLL